MKKLIMGDIGKNVKEIGLNWSENFIWEIEIHDEDGLFKYHVHKLEFTNIDSYEVFEDTSGTIYFKPNTQCIIKDYHAFPYRKLKIGKKLVCNKYDE